MDAKDLYDGCPVIFENSFNLLNGHAFENVPIGTKLTVKEFVKSYITDFYEDIVCDRFSLNLPSAPQLAPVFLSGQKQFNVGDIVRYINCNALPPNSPMTGVVTGKLFSVSAIATGAHGGPVIGLIGMAWGQGSMVGSNRFELHLAVAILNAPDPLSTQAGPDENGNWVNEDERKEKIIREQIRKQRQDLRDFLDGK